MNKRKTGSARAPGQAGGVSGGDRKSGKRFLLILFKIKLKRNKKHKAKLLYLPNPRAIGLFCVSFSSNRNHSCPAHSTLFTKDKFSKLLSWFALENVHHYPDTIPCAIGALVVLFRNKYSVLLGSVSATVKFHFQIYFSGTFTRERH